jgi:hypothetical protein
MEPETGGRIGEAIGTAIWYGFCGVGFGFAGGMSLDLMRRPHAPEPVFAFLLVGFGFSGGVALGLWTVMAKSQPDAHRESPPSEPKE